MKVSLILNDERVALDGSPFKLLKDINTSGLTASLIMNTGERDGGEYVRSFYNTREFEIEGMIHTHGQSQEWVNEKREILYKICDPKETLTIEIEKDGEFFYLKAHPVSFPIFASGIENSNNSFQTFLMQFVSSDPYLYKAKQFVTFANVEPLFKFPMAFNNVTMGSKLNTLTKNIENKGNVSSPLEIIIKINGIVDNPFIYNTTTNKKILIKDTTLATGDEIYIYTGARKEVSLTRNGIKTIYYYALDITSDFLQLEKGDNVFTFGASLGQELMEIQINYEERLAGF